MKLLLLVSIIVCLVVASDNLLHMCDKYCVFDVEMPANYQLEILSGDHFRVEMYLNKDKIASCLTNSHQCKLYSDNAITKSNYRLVNYTIDIEFASSNKSSHFYVYDILPRDYSEEYWTELIMGLIVGVAFLSSTLTIIYVKIVHRQKKSHYRKLR